MTGIAVVAVPISLIWLVNALWLGRRQNSLEMKQAAAAN